MSIYSASLFFSFLSSRFLPFHLFCSHNIWVSRLSFPPPLFLLLSWPLISCFLLSILTQDWCALLRSCLPLKNWQPTLMSTDITFFYTLPILRPFVTHSVHKKMTDKLFDCLLSQNRSALWLQTVSDLHYFMQRFEWKPTHDASLQVMWL